MKRDPVVGEYVSPIDYPDVVFKVENRKWNGGTVICELTLVGARSGKALRRWHRKSGWSLNTRKYRSYLDELTPANEMLVLALESRDY